MSQRHLIPLKGLLEAAMDVLAEHGYVRAMHVLDCTCSLCNLQRSVDYQRKFCGLNTCGLRRHEHHDRDHRFYEQPVIHGKKPKTKKGKAWRAMRLQELANRE